MKNNLLHILLSIIIPCLSLQVHAQIQLGSDIEGELAFDYSGWSVSMPDANTLAVGAPKNNGVGADAGHVRIFTWNGSTWIQKGLDIDAEAAGDQFGHAVSMADANTVAVGAPYNDGSAIGAGHVRVFSWNGSTWLQKGTDIDGKDASDFSGYSVSMGDAGTVAIGAYGNDDNGSNAGHVRIYSWNGSAWAQKGSDILGEATNDNSGWSVSMPDANTVAIGARLNDGGASDAGHVRVYSWNGSAWTIMGSDIDGSAANDHSGWSVSMPDASTVSIGSPGNDGSGSNAGAVRVFSWNGNAWTQTGNDLDGEYAADESGTAISMPDANTVAIGAPGNSALGNWTGHVRVFSWNGSTWIQMGNDIDGEAANDASGSAVSMGDATTVASGAYLNDGIGTDAGHVRVYGAIPTGLSESPGTEMKIYPNPATDQIILEGKNAFSTIEVVDVVGKKIIEVQPSSQSGILSLDIHQLKPGVYFLKANDIQSKIQGIFRFVKD